MATRFIILMRARCTLCGSVKPLYYILFDDYMLWIRFYSQLRKNDTHEARRKHFFFLLLFNSESKFYCILEIESHIG